ncbi:MAG: glycoside hydrolase [Mycobacterium sp.]|jgi:hypothetical protein|nr:glycoside hydrolase [Mycobacterium sp.]
MFAVASLLALVSQVSGTPYVSGGDSPAGTDCSGLASWVSNAATNRPVFGDRFHTGNQESALLARGFKYGTQPGALVIGWNGGHTAVTLPDGTPVSSGEGGGVKIGGGGAYQSQFTKHMYLPMEPAAQPAPDGMIPPPPPGFVPPPPGELPPPPPADAMAPVPLDVPPPPPPLDPMAPPPPAPDGLAPAPASFPL